MQAGVRGFMVPFLVALASVAPSAQTVGEELESRLVAPITACGEVVVVDFTARTVAHIFDDSAGGVHIKLGVVSKGTGVGMTTGANYVLSDELNEETNVAGPSEQSEITLTINHVLISSGETDNAYLKATLHVTFNGRGLLTAEVTQLEAACRG